MATQCVCGNELESTPAYKLRVSPCRCEAPGPGARTLQTGLPWHLFEKQYEERRRLGLPLLTDTERAARSRWV